MIDSGGGTGDVEVLAYVNSNLIVIKNEQPKISSSSTSSSSIPPEPLKPLVPSIETATKKNAETTQKLNLSSKSVTIINEAVIKNKTLDLKSKQQSSKNSGKKTISDPVVANFTVDGWPISKSRMAPNYVNYDQESATLVPKKPFTSELASKFISK